jgi:hypothetical protein
MKTDVALELRRFGLPLGRRPFETVVLISPQMSLAFGRLTTMRGSRHETESLLQSFLQYLADNVEIIGHRHLCQDSVPGLIT